MEDINNILDAWTLIEQFNEGNIEINKKSSPNFLLPLLDFDRASDFYHFFQQKIANKQKEKYNNTLRPNSIGIIVYFDIFNFQSIIDLIVQEHNLSDLRDETFNPKHKFGLAIVFDKELKLIEDQTFVTASYYVKMVGKLFSSIRTFENFEQSIKTIINSLFAFCTKELESADFITAFNGAFSKLCDTFQANINSTYYSVVNDTNTEIINLHSFFIDDLKAAKTANSGLLKRYINGFSEEKRINLNPSENITIFKKILQPKYYPLGHFFTKYPASLMQQVAINLALNDHNDLRTVNGPPGTGKTTLLKDIFAELIVEQANEICHLSKKNLYSKEDSEFGQTALPESIANKNIIVASSNNGAVQNIVNDLPHLPSQKDTFENIIKELKATDYFEQIANSDSTNYWGLVSKEGGKRKNINEIIGNIKQVVDDLKKENYQPHYEAYNEFIDQYNKVKSKRDRLQKYAEFIFQKQDWDQEAEKYHLQFDFNGKIIFSSISLKIDHAGEEIDLLKADYAQLKEKSRQYGLFRKIINWFLDHFFNSHNAETEQRILQDMENLNKEIKQKTYKKQELEKKLNNLQSQAYELASEANKFADLHVKVPNYNRDFTDRKTYEEFENETYWFTESDLEDSSLLFVLALKVRKQFLYENRKSLSAALGNWYDRDKKVKQNQQELTSRAWQWINFTIPVISTTFASFHRMFENLPDGTIANLFIDEAGQATPQSVVGALLKSKRVLAVGDPAQIKPVNSLDSKVLSLIGNRMFNVSEKFVSSTASIQTIMDEASQFGFYKDQEHGEWIGIPLWVHRRCKNPMFSIANAISYDNKMVLPKSAENSTGEGRWYDVKGSSIDKFVQRQADFLKEKIQELITSTSNPFQQKDIFVITPFKNVANKLANTLASINFSQGHEKNIGTVHTFQGRENQVVFLVLGASAQEEGAASWAVSEPNIINVAATRAKEQFFIIGDKKLYQSLGSVTVDKTISVLNKYEK